MPWRVWSGLILVVVLLAGAPLVAWGQPSLNATHVCAGDGVSSLTCNDVTVNAGTARVMLIGVGWRNCGTGATQSLVTAASYGGADATLAHTRCSGTSVLGNEHRLVIGPPSGTAELSVTLDKVANSVILGHQTWNGVAQASPIRASESITGSGTSGNVTVTSVAGDLVVGLAVGQNTTLVPGQTSHGGTTSGIVVLNASSTSATTTSTQMSWTRSGSDFFVLQALSVIPATAITRRRLWVVQP